MSAPLDAAVGAALEADGAALPAPAGGSDDAAAASDAGGLIASVSGLVDWEGRLTATGVELGGDEATLAPAVAAALLPHPINGTDERSRNRPVRRRGS
jgi:hypothetical protein